MKFFSRFNFSILDDCNHSVNSNKKRNVHSIPLLLFIHLNKTLKINEDSKLLLTVLTVYFLLFCSELGS